MSARDCQAERSIAMLQVKEVRRALRSTPDFANVRSLFDCSQRITRPSICKEACFSGRRNWSGQDCKKELDREYVSRSGFRIATDRTKQDLQKVLPLLQWPCKRPVKWGWGLLVSLELTKVRLNVRRLDEKSMSTALLVSLWDGERGDGRRWKEGFMNGMTQICCRQAHRSRSG